MKKIYLLLLFLPFSLFSQPVLGPHIGQSSTPALSDPVCSIPVYTGEMDTSGYAEGELVNDFTLYKTNGDSVRLSDALSNGKPVLLIAGNYTCPVFRQRIPEINAVTSFYGSALQVYVVYVNEAHPIVDPSPYSGMVWVTSQNNAEGVLFEQPDTYGERLNLIDSLLDNYSIVPEILVDGPCNEWWLNYGPAPNNCYLIDTTGIVHTKQGWFNRAPENIWCEIDSLLGTTSGNCINYGTNGFLTYELEEDSVVYGAPADVLAVHGMLRNMSSTDNVEIDISKQMVSVPAGWSTALCADICYATTVSSANVTLAPLDSLPFIFYFYTTSVPDSGYAKLRFKNVNLVSNTVIQRYIGLTTAPASINEQVQNSLQVFPNPATDELFIKTEFKNEEKYFLCDALGRIVISGELRSGNAELSLKELPSGIYFLRVAELSIKVLKQ
jgi:hypothetical protein